MKKIISLALVFFCVLTLVGCTGGDKVVTSEIFIEGDDEVVSSEKINVNGNSSNDDKDYTDSKLTSTSSKKAVSSKEIDLLLNGNSIEKYTINCIDSGDETVLAAANKLSNEIYNLTGKRVPVGNNSNFRINISTNESSDGLPNTYKIEFNNNNLNIIGDSSFAVIGAVDKFISQFKDAKTTKSFPKTYKLSGKVDFKKIGYNDNNLKFVGRWKENEGGVSSLWNYSSVEISFTGNYIVAEVSASQAPGSQVTDPCVLVTVDGGEQYSEIVENGYLIFSFDDKTKHTIKLAGNVSNTANFKAFYLPDNGKISAPKSRKNIMFIGDSITHYTSCYSFLVGDILGWDYSVVAQAGMSLQNGEGWYKGGIEKTGMETCFFKNESAAYTTELTDYNFKYTSAPDVVVIYLGTNDYTKATDKSALNKFTETYSNFVGAIRKKFPNCTIYMMESVSSKADLKKRVTAIVDAAYNRISNEYKNVKLIKSSAWDIEGQEDGIHPTSEGSKVFAKNVAEVIKNTYGK